MMCVIATLIKSCFQPVANYSFWSLNHLLSAAFTAVLWCW